MNRETFTLRVGQFLGHMFAPYILFLLRFADGVAPLTQDVLRLGKLTVQVVGKTILYGIGAAVILLCVFGFVARYGALGVLVLLFILYKL